VVFPVPSGALTSTSLPDKMKGMERACTKMKDSFEKSFNLKRCSAFLYFTCSYLVRNEVFQDGSVYWGVFEGFNAIREVLSLDSKT